MNNGSSSQRDLNRCARRPRGATAGDVRISNPPERVLGQYGLAGQVGCEQFAAMARVERILKVLFWILMAAMVALGMGAGRQFNRFDSQYAPAFLLVWFGTIFGLTLVSYRLGSSDKRFTVVGWITVFVAVGARYSLVWWG